MSYELDTIALVTTFAHYAQNRELPATLFSKPDYVSLQADGIQDFSSKLKEVEPKAEQITVAEAEDRFVASIRLTGSLSLADLGRLRWLEIVEPTEEEVITGLMGADRIGFYCADFEEARTILSARDVPFIVEEVPAPTIKVPFRESGTNSEFTLSKVPLGELVMGDIEANKVTIVKQAA